MNSRSSCKKKVKRERFFSHQSQSGNFFPHCGTYTEKPSRKRRKSDDDDDSIDFDIANNNNDSDNDEDDDNENGEFLCININDEKRNNDEMK